MTDERANLERLLRAENIPEESIRRLLEEGYDTKNVIKAMSVEQMEEIGLRKGDISKLKLVISKLQNSGPTAFDPMDYLRKKFASVLQFGDAPLCRFCSDSWASVTSDTQPMKKKNSAHGSSLRGGQNSRLSQTSNTENPTESCPQNNSMDYCPRSPEEITKLVSVWQSYAHPRARNFFATTEMLEHVLTQVARGVDAADDPILADGDKCIFWYGDVTKEEEAAIRMVKPGEEKESITYVNRVLAFIFATDDSFQKLMALPKTPFKMCCQNQLCINLSHISSSAE
ncbi:unnamed protein product [Amoebophrya sp. A120]|nr:unnamed protein product [Amoebophrya sp. A120]|eukprot:GSA120T00024311001.1